MKPVRPRPIPIWTRTITLAVLPALIITVLPGGILTESHAMLGPAEPAAPRAEASARAHDLEAVQKVLEAKMVQQRLEDLGLSPEAASERLHRLTDAQLHQLAMQIESLIPGGIDHVLGTILTVLLIILVAVIIIILV